MFLAGKASKYVVRYFDSMQNRNYERIFGPEGVKLKTDRDTPTIFKIDFSDFYDEFLGSNGFITDF